MVHTAGSAQGAGPVEQGFGKGGLACVHMGKQTDIRRMFVHGDTSFL
jgi:hypothetical protein